MSLLDHPEAQVLLTDATVSADTVRDCSDRYWTRSRPCWALLGR